MLPYASLIVVDKNALLPVYQQIANTFIDLIREGVLKPGNYLPPSRQLAEQLQLHRKTIVAAYDELAAQDWVETRPRKGIMVSLKLPEIKPRKFKEERITHPYQKETSGFFQQVRPSFATPEKGGNFKIVVNDGFPDARIAPVDNLLKQYRSFLKKSYAQHMFMRGAAQGSLNLREQLASFLHKTRAIDVNANNVLITRGAQMAIFIAAGMVLKPGSTVIVGEPGYFMANNIFEHFGAKLIRVKVDENGIDVDAIERICKKKRPDLLYIIPHHHHPTTVTLSAERRMKLLEIIRTYSLPAIEDDYDYDFHYNNSPILPLASADHNGYVLYIGSVTKTLAAAIRIGYLVAGAAFINQAAGIREMLDIRGDVLMEEALAVLYKNGDMQKHLNKAVKLYHERRDFLCDLLESELSDMVTFTRPPGGMSVWLQFKPAYKLPDVARIVAQQGIYINDGSLYNSGTVNYNALRVGFASLNEQELRELVMALKKAV